MFKRLVVAYLPEAVSCHVTVGGRAVPRGGGADLCSIEVVFDGAVIHPVDHPYVVFEVHPHTYRL